MSVDHSKLWNSLSDEAHASTSHVHTLLDHEEQKMLYYFASQVPSQGTIVDLGCHLGGSTARMAAGALSAGFEGGIHLFDRFEVKYPLSKLQGHLPERFHQIADQENTEPLVRALLAELKADFQFHNCEFMDHQWRGGNVDLLFVDIGKNLRTMDHVAEQFYPNLTAVKSIVIQQDFQYLWNPWVPLHMEIWADKFEYLAHTESESVIFRLIDPINRAEAEARRMVNLSDGELKDLFAKSQMRYAHTSVSKRLAKMAEMIGDGEFPRRTIGKKFIRLKDQRFNDEAAEKLRKAQTTSGINARRRAKRAERESK